MAQKSKIEWTESTWNPVTGCTRISDGCKNCYAYKMAIRLKGMGMEKYRKGFDVTMHPECLNDPYGWKKPMTIFVNSMSDLYHDDVSDNYIYKIFDVMNRTPQHTYQILTKRAKRLNKMAKNLDWTPNIWQGVTVENERAVDRIGFLKGIHAKVKFISFEPLLTDVGILDLSGIDWAIVGGESGIGARKLEEEWILSIKSQCEAQNVLFYFKQWGGRSKRKAGRQLLGQTWNDMPVFAHQLK
jgi:protein gp37